MFALPPISTHSMQIHSKTKTLLYTPKALLSTRHPTTSFTLDPTSYTQASKSQHWRDVMAKQLDALAHNNTWTLVPVLEASNIVGCK
jgi:hypothetical protein